VNLDEVPPHDVDDEALGKNLESEYDKDDYESPIPYRPVVSYLEAL